MTENEKINGLSFGEYEAEVAPYSVRSTTPDYSGTTDDGGYTPPTNPTPEIQTSTEVPGGYPQPSDPGSDLNGSSTTDGGQSDTTMPIYPSVTLISPSTSKTEQLKDDHRIQIEAKGTNCSSIKVYVNGTCMYTASGNYLAYSYPVNAAGKYTICVVGTSSTGHTDSVTIIVTVKDTYTVTYNLNDGLGITPEAQTAKVGESVTLAVLADPQKCYKLDNTFDGWYNPLNGDLYYQGYTTSFDADVTLYPKFTTIIE